MRGHARASTRYMPYKGNLCTSATVNKRLLHYVILKMDNNVQSALENPKKRKWTENEETVLIQCVVEREGDLFGEIKGVGTKKKSVARREGWGEISNILNSQFSTAKREADEVKKKYFNLKQRAKEKIDIIKRSSRMTGGGPAPPSLTSAEEALANSLAGRPVVEGFEGGIDTDANEDSSITQCSSLADAPQVSEKTIKKKSRPASSEMDKLMTENLKLDNQRLELEVMKLRKETEKISEEIAYFNIKKIYYQLKMQAEFQIPITDPEM